MCWVLGAVPGAQCQVLSARRKTFRATTSRRTRHQAPSTAPRTGHRALTVHWGPWAPAARHGGMVGPELARAYGRRGIGLIDPEEGTAALLRELAWGDASATAVVYTSSGW